jgi:hypothetical protein
LNKQTQINLSIKEFALQVTPTIKMQPNPLLAVEKPSELFEVRFFLTSSQGKKMYTHSME